MTEQNASAPVTVVVSRRVKAGQEAAFEALSEELTKSAMPFPGHMGATMLRPASKVDPEYRIIFKFEDQAKLDKWLSSDVRKHYLAQIENLLEVPSKVETVNSLVTWFTLPGGAKAVKPPPRYKMAIVSWLALFPIVTAIFYLFGKQLEHIPLVPRVALVTAVVMVLMTWVAMPQLTKVFAGWLYPKTEDNLR